MAKILSNGYKFSACNNNNNHGFGCNKFDHLAPVMIKMPVNSSFRSKSTVNGELFGRRRVGIIAAAASESKMGIISIGKSLKWWEKGLQPNMKEITGAEDLVESLLKAGDKLVVVDFFSPGCGGCRALHPKLCQLAEMNPDVQFLQVNYEEHKSMCYSLGVHVLPFFRFYRGAEGRLCSFSCTNATIKKFKDALAKHKPERCSLGPTKGLEEKELVALGANRDLSFVYDPKPEHPQKEVAPPPLAPVPTVAEVGSGLGTGSPSLPLPLPIPLKSTLVASGR
ncbi:thioredoxin-like 1-1, chloroplastic [Bidens hawaiensis]|uniref:thioredoxin-like 1-1, chloroplastic n=1 Tax=Bidens hawaiensis TaxID=980011 RepID=UPI0040497FC2